MLARKNLDAHHYILNMRIVTIGKLTGGLTTDFTVADLEDESVS